MTFEEYLIAKKIDQKTFKQAESALYESWKIEFEQIHPNSFTVQKFYLINPIRRKYTLKLEPVKISEEKTLEKEKIAESVITSSLDNLTEAKPNSSDQPVTQAPKPARPVFKPKPKIN